MSNYIIIPTYKEYENLSLLIPILKKFHYKIVIVDDNSQDGTEELIKFMKGKIIYKDDNKIIDGDDNLILIERKNNRGLSLAILDGIKYIKSIDNKAKIVVTDADFQHDYNIIPDIFNLLDKYDIVECVRRNKSSMGFSRKIISNFAEGLARILIPEIRKLKDPMTGFFGFKLDKVDINKIKPKGYKIFLDIYLNSTMNIGYLYYDFGKRKYGKSKLTYKQIFEYILQLLSLQNYRVLKYILIGISGIFVNEGVAYLLHTYTSLPLWLIFVISVEISIYSNFILNSFITFKERLKYHNIIILALKHNFYRILTLILNVVIATFLSFFMNYLIANLIAIFITFILNYITAEHFIWSIKFY